MKLDPILPQVLDGNVLNGRRLATHVKERVAEVVENLYQHDGFRLCLAVILVGDEKSSASSRCAA